MTGSADSDDALDSDPTPDLVAVAESALGFWDNPFDDEDWNSPGPM